MIPRRIILQKTGNNEYMCSGNSCGVCKLRFECFTNGLYHVFFLNWDEIHQEYRRMSPLIALKQVTGGKVFVKGSRKYKEMLHIRVQSYMMNYSVSDADGRQAGCDPTLIGFESRQTLQ